MSGDTTRAAGETRLPDEPEIRLYGEDEAGQGSGRRDLAALGIAAGIFGLALLLYRDASTYPVRRSYAQFGPEIVPYIVASGLAVLAILTAISAWRGGFEARERLNVGGVAWLAGAIMAQIALIYSGSGFIIASTVLFACAARAFGQTTYLLNLAIGGAMSLLLFLLFRYGLGLALPNGPLERVIDQFLR